MTRYIPIEEAVRVVDMCFFIQGVCDDGLKNTICKSIEKNSNAIEDVAPVIHAHWKCNGAWSMAKQCSNCSFVYKGETDYMGNVHYQASNYCPNCGAKMDEGASE